MQTVLAGEQPTEGLWEPWFGAMPPDELETNTSTWQRDMREVCRDISTTELWGN